MQILEISIGDIALECFQGAALARAPDDAPHCAVLQPRDLEGLFVESLPTAQPAKVNLHKQRLHPGDVLVSLRGQPMRASVFHPQGDTPSVGGNTLGILRLDLRQVNEVFLVGLLRSRLMEDRLRAYYAQTTSGLSISLSELRRAKIPLPPLDIQAEIATVFIAAEKFEVLTAQLLAKRRDLLEATLAELLET